MLAPGLANVVLAQHFVLGGLPTLKNISVSYSKRFLLLGRALLLQLWTSKLVLLQEWWLQG